jgi:polyisoprenoid-binding protein YceI
MNPICPALALALSLGATSLAAQPVRYEVDPTHTFVMYEMGHYATTTNRGRFSTKRGSVTMDRTAHTGKVDIVIDITSINTGVDLLNRHVQSSDFFDVARFPTGRFTSEKLDFDGDKLTGMQGSLTLMGQTRPVTLKALRFNCYNSPLFKREVCGGDFETVVQRSQWGLTWGLAFGFEDQVKLLVQVEGVRMDAPGQ